jgi:DNA-binding response OmpR family regulator
MKILVVDDDCVLADVVAFTLRRAGYEIVQAYDGEIALRVWETEDLDLIVLDVNLPKLDGFSICKLIREKSQIPIILLTVRDEEEDILKGLDLGADDYIPKPFSPRQLVARVRAVLRRAGSSPTTALRELGDLTLDTNRREARIGKREAIPLTPLECRLLDYLMLNAGLVMRIDDLIGHLWGPGGGDRDMLRQLIHRLRAKIEPDIAHPKYIETISGMGYGIAIDEPSS